MMRNFKGTKNNLLLWLVIVIVLSIAYNIFADISSSSRRIVFSEFLNQVDAGNVREVSIRGNVIDSKDSSGKHLSTLSPHFYPQLVDHLREKGATVEILPTETSLGSFFNIILSWFPVLLLAGVWIYFMRSVQSGGKAMGFGKSKAKLVSDSNNKITFADVAGVDEAKEELQEIVDFLKEPAKFQRLGGKIPRGCLLVGPPGTGKTLLARAVAGEAGVAFFSISGSDFVEMFVGVGASRVRDMFAQAKKHAPCILFIDEIDAVGRHRGAGLGGGNDEREQTLNQLLVEMDGFTENENIIVLAATNRPDVLDPALLRPKRFDRQIVVPLPDVNGREHILKVHLQKVPIAPDVTIRFLARGTPGFSGADLANIVNEAALMAARLNRKHVSMDMLEHAKDKVMMGAERRSMVMSYDQRKLTAYHEGGHVLVLLYMPASDPLHKATIIPRGRALGVTMPLPEDDRYSFTHEELKAKIAVYMGGRVAEELVFGLEKVTTGASNDIKVATQLARKMVTQWGLSSNIGPVLVGEDREEVFLGHSLGKQNTVSEELAKKIDYEVKNIIEAGYDSAKCILMKYITELHRLAEALLEYETLSGEEIKNLLANKPIKKEDTNNTKQGTSLDSDTKWQQKDKRANPSVPTTSESSDAVA
ncbi:ATP-dependent zinc metalloprotease FtsH [Alphaproteobacteria bacterium]